MTLVQNAIITSVSLDDGDHGLLTGWVTLDFGSSAQGFGGFALYLPHSFKNHKAQANVAGHFIWRVMQVAGVSSWNAVPGKTVRVRHSMSRVEAIGHIIKEDWFCPDLEFRQLIEINQADDEPRGQILR